MTDWRKAKVAVDAVYRSGDILCQGYNVPARCSILAIPGAPDKFRELSIRLVVDSRNAEELLEGLANGTVTLSIEQMLSTGERESKS